MRVFGLILIAVIVTSCAPTLTYHLEYENYGELSPILSIGANSVVRLSNITLEIESTSKAVYTEQKAITILNEAHDFLATLDVGYDKLSSIDYMKVNLINKHGDIIRSYTMDDAKDYSAYDGFSVFTDNRIKVLELVSSSYPYTIEYEYQKTYKSTLILPNWAPQVFDQSIEKANFSVIDHGTGVRFHQQNLQIEPFVNQAENNVQYSWLVESTLAKSREPFSPNPREILPVVLVAPGNFKIEDSEGDASTWESFGQWYFDLGKETRELPEGAKQEIDALIQGVTDPKEVVHILYDYLQEKNRYVSIQLGIGGFQPFTADYVYRNRYGDCKALTNYMQAALEYVGIIAEPVLIGVNGYPDLIEEFPSSQFNHVILRVTLDDGQVIWLECTSKYLPPNNLGAGRTITALLVTEEGGEIVATPDADHTENIEINKYSIQLDEQGNATLNAELVKKGVFQGGVLGQLLRVSENDQVEWLERSLPVDRRTIVNYDFSELQKSDEKALITYKAKLTQYANSTSKRLYIPINAMNEWRMYVPKEENRTQELKFRFAFSEVDSTHLTVPQGYQIESMPRDQSLKNEFANYHSRVQKLDEDTFLYVRTIELTERVIVPDNYSKLRTFLDDVRRADGQQMVLVKAES